MPSGLTDSRHLRVKCKAQKLGKKEFRRMVDFPWGSMDKCGCTPDWTQMTGEVSVVSQQVYSQHCFQGDGWVSRGISGAAVQLPGSSTEESPSHQQLFTTLVTWRRAWESYNFIISFLSSSLSPIFPLGEDFPI